jgi:hypothetical protein
MELSPSSEPASCSATQEFPKILCSQKPFHWSLSRARWIQSIPPHHISLRSVLILASYLHQGLPSGRFPSSLTTKTLYASSPMRATYPAHLILDLIILIIFGDSENHTKHMNALCGSDLATGLMTEELGFDPHQKQIYSTQRPFSVSRINCLIARFNVPLCFLPLLAVGTAVSRAA